MYSAPKTHRVAPARHRYGCGCDVWSLGSIASELLVWSLKGNNARLAYQSRRSIATKETPLAGGYFEGAFHNGHERLRVVDQEHASLDFDDGDYISPAVSNFILDKMLVTPISQRLDPMGIYQEWNEVKSSFLTIDGVLRPAERDAGRGLDSAGSKRSASMRMRPNVDVRSDRGSSPAYRVPVFISSYSLSRRVLEEWLRQLFDDSVIQVKVWVFDVTAKLS